MHQIRRVLIRVLMDVTFPSNLTALYSRAASKDIWHCLRDTTYFKILSFYPNVLIERLLLWFVSFFIGTVLEWFGPFGKSHIFLFWFSKLWSPTWPQLSSAIPLLSRFQMYLPVKSDKTKTFPDYRNYLDINFLTYKKTLCQPVLQILDNILDWIMSWQSLLYI